jgi:hypothetical protein
MYQMRMGGRWRERREAQAEDNVGWYDKELEPILKARRSHWRELSRAVTCQMCLCLRKTIWEMNGV